MSGARFSRSSGRSLPWEGSAPTRHHTNPREHQAADITAFDNRPIRARGFYDLSFFDTDNEYESYGLEVMQQDEARFQAFFQRYLQHLNSDFVSDADFDREFTYERLVELDVQLMRRGGLSSSELRSLLQPMRGVVTECTICLETSRRHERVARLVCSHVFHTECLQRWLGDHYTCPLCRHDLRSDNSRVVDAADDDDVGLY